MKRPLRVAMVAACPFPAARGTPVRIYRLAEALARRGYDVCVLAYHLGEADARPPFRIRRTRDIAWYRYTEPGPTLAKLCLLDPMLTLRLRAFLKRRSVDLVHAHHYEGLLAAMMARPHGLPVIYDAHTTLGSELPTYDLGLPAAVTRRIGQALDRRLPRHAAHTVAVTEAVQARLVELGAVRAERITVVPNGIEPEMFALPPDRESPGETGTQVVMYAGNLAPYQRLDLLLEAFAKVRHQRPRARLVIASLSSFEPYRDLARSLRVDDAVAVRQAGFRDLPSVLAGADVVVSSRLECDGIPQKLLNYMAAGRPIVAFEGSFASLVHERTGLCVANGDTNAMAAAILRVLGDPTLARRLGDAAREQVHDGCSWKDAGLRLEAVYERVLREAAERSPGSSRVPAS